MGLVLEVTAKMQNCSSLVQYINNHTKNRHLMIKKNAKLMVGNYQFIEYQGVCVMLSPFQHLCTLLLLLGPAVASDTPTPLTSLFPPRSASL